MTRSYARSALMVGALLAGGCNGTGTLGGAGGGDSGTNPTTGTGGSADASLPGSSGGSGSGGGGGGSTGGIAGTDGPGASGDASDALSGDASTVALPRRHGKSPGCGMAPVAAGNQQLSVPVCMGCSAKLGNCPRDCIAPEFAPGGASVVGGQNFTSRSFSFRLPAGYQQDTAYPVFLGGSGCGGGASGYNPSATGAITVSLAILTGNHPDGSCFADGGIACSGTAANIPLCVNGPEMPYVRGILSYLESHLCVDLDREFIGGVSSGAWEATTLGCGDADQLRGFVSVAGGKREHRWPCTGPIAAFMIADTGDSGNPIGPLAQINTPSLDSFGSAPQRDELLIRNGCQGNASTVYDPAYPMCVKYTGCPGAYPVVWCALPGGHTNTTAGGVNYSGAIWPFFKALPPPP
ncbi:MAG: polyhydroxybutyrate depolymerase [Myxococcales bacterium]|nr:polyhydroxybutyrate depolymerase [Myxococcales bacterium]